MDTSGEVPRPLPVCPTHTRSNWLEHRGYRDNHDSSISCMFCGWGTRIAGYYRVLDDRVVDLRTYGSDSVSTSA